MVTGSEVLTLQKTLQNLKCVTLVCGQDNMKNLKSLEVTEIEKNTILGAGRKFGNTATRHNLRNIKYT